MAPPAYTSPDSSNGEVVEEEFGRYLKLVNRLANMYNLPEGLHNKVINFKHPKELETILDLKLRKDGMNISDLEKLFENVIEYSMKTGDSRFYNQFYQGIDETALAGTWLSEALNTNQHTFEVAPVFMVIERAMIAHIAQLMNYPDFEGLCVPGGSIGNMYGMCMARYAKYPDSRESGIFGKKPLVALTSEECHYSLIKCCQWLGIGTDNLYEVKTDDRGRVIPADLERNILKAKAEGKEPFFMNATTGTTVLGAFDPLDEIADICAKYSIWLHIDGAWGGSALLSPKYKYLLKGVERCDSFAWNPHKMLGVPLQCTIFLTRHKDILMRCNAASAPYLFQTDKFYDMTYDTGDKSVQCGRKVDSFKLWVMWKVRGEDHLSHRVTAAFDLSRYLRDLVMTRSGFRMVAEEIDGPNVCFWYIPKCLRGQEETKEWWKQVGEVAPKIKEQMVRSGHLMVGYSPLPRKNIVNFFRVVISSLPMRSHQDIHYMVDEIERLGELS